MVAGTAGKENAYFVGEFMGQGIILIILVFGKFSPSLLLLNFYKLKKRKEIALYINTLISSLLIYVLCIFSFLLHDSNSELSLTNFFFAIYLPVLVITLLIYIFFSNFFIRCPYCNRRIKGIVDIFEFDIFEKCLNEK